jgi:LacI family transcriptional regulator
MKTRVTQADVAKSAGVHVTTVSLALRNHPSLPPGTRQRIQTLAEEMGYRPDPDLRALMAYRRGTRERKSSSTLAYVTNAGGMWDWKKAPAHGEFFAGASARATQLGYNLDHFWMREPGLSHQRLSNILISRGITGVILASQWAPECESVNFDWTQLSGVKIDFFPHGTRLHTVSNDQRAIIQLAMQRVTAAGYTRIGLVMPSWWDDCVDLAWSAGFLAEQSRLPAKDHIPILFFSVPADEPHPPQPFPSPVPASVFEEWLREHRPEVLISYAPFVLPRLEAAGLRIPQDIAFVDLFLLGPSGRTAGVRHNCARVGEMAVEVLDGQLQQNTFGLPEFQTATLIEGTWFDGESLPMRSLHPAEQMCAR